MVQDKTQLPMGNAAALYIYWDSAVFLQEVPLHCNLLKALHGSASVGSCLWPYPAVLIINGYGLPVMDHFRRTLNLINLS